MFVTIHFPSNEVNGKVRSEMSCPHLLYEELFTEIGKAWDTSLNDNGLAITILDKTKEEIQKREGEGERTDVLLELIDVSIQLFSREDGGKQQEYNSSRTTPSMRKRVSQSSESQSSTVQSSPFNVDSSSKRKRSSQESLTWQDVIGQDDAKRALYESCLLPTLLPSSLFVGCRQLCTTILLHGPPGTGKTSLVRAVANESRHLLLSLVM